MYKNRRDAQKIAIQPIYTDLKLLIEQSRQDVAVAVNASISMLYWQVGKRINVEVLHEKRASYGKEVVVNLSRQLEMEFGKGWSEKQLRHCMQFASVIPDKKIVSTLWRQLSWSHLKLLIYIEDPLKRAFYIEICKMEKWSVRIFQERIQSLLYERTAISKKPEITIQKELESLKKNQIISPDLVFRDPYFLDFLGLKESYSERDLESTILFELQKFIIELGSDFAFLARQKRITIDQQDYFIDLLFFHRRLKCLIAVELKMGSFEAAHKGQMELYLRWLEKYEKMPDENPPIGLLLCASKNQEHIELLQIDKSNIKVAEYLTKLPDLKILEQKLHLAVEIANMKQVVHKEKST